MREENLFDPLVAYLESGGYRILEQHRGHERGVDIVADKNGRKLYVQLKGDSMALDVDFGTNLYQVMKLMTSQDADYAIGVSEAYRPHVLKCENGLRRLGVFVFVISEAGVKKAI